MIDRDFGATGTALPVIGQGTWRLGENAGKSGEESRALRLGVELGMAHIDTAEMYGSGMTEEFVGAAIDGIRDKVFLASKVLPSNASYKGTIDACDRTLMRLRVDYLDLYMLHWPSRHPIEETMAALEDLVDEGKTRYIGVSNFEVDEMRRAQRALTRQPLASNQVAYHLKARGIELKLIPYCQEQGIAVVGYSPFGSGSFPSRGEQGRVLNDIASRCGKTPRQVALNFLTRLPGTFTIPKAGIASHVRENAGAADWELSPGDVSALNRAFPAPDHDVPLTII
jgi:diketogulonate reductase-like aldo/keto reductase